MIRLEKVLKISLQDVLKTSSKCLEDVLKMSWRCLEDVFKTSWKTFSRRLIAKTNILVLTKTSWRRLEDVFWRRKAKANIFVLIKTSWRRLEDVFWRRRRKTSSRRLQGVFIKTNVCWVYTGVHLLKFLDTLTFTPLHLFSSASNCIRYCLYSLQWTLHMYWRLTSSEKTIEI